ETATNIVMGQIADGTRSWEIPAANSIEKGKGVRLTHVPQPGLVRTYDADGKPGRTFKLYSNDTMVLKPGSEWVVSKELAAEVPANWPAKPAQYVDLNAPVLTPDANGDITF